MLAFWSHGGVVFPPASHFITSSRLPCLGSTDAHPPHLRGPVPLPPKWRSFPQGLRTLPHRGPEQVLCVVIVVWLLQSPRVLKFHVSININIIVTCFVTTRTFPRNQTHNDVDNAHRNSIFIFTQHIINYSGTSGTNPHLKEKEKHPPYLEGRRLAHGGKSPSTLVPCLILTALPLLSNPPSPLPTPLAHTILQWRRQQLQSSCPEQ